MERKSLESNDPLPERSGTVITVLLLPNSNCCCAAIKKKENDDIKFYGQIPMHN